MRTFKYIDLWINLSLILAGIILAFIMPGDGMFWGYFLVGGWQIISMLVHLIARSYFYNGSSRKVYTYSVGVIVGIVLVSIAVYPLIIIELWFLLFAAPLMAIYYTAICYKEVYFKMKRPLSILK